MNLHQENIEGSYCPRFEIAEYIDGELSSREEFDMELHFATCEICTEELNAQKKVSTTLEIMLDEQAESIKLPENFTKIITAKAESSLDGLRSPKERSRALFICIILLFLLFFGFSTNGDSVLFAINKFSDQFFAVGGFIFHLFYTISLGISAIFGSLCHKFIFKSSLTILMLITAFVLSFFTLSRMVFRYNRS